jgi:twitching motility two-component system response regulator PilH
MLLDTVLTRTRKGAVALNDQSVPLSGGFRKFLSLVDGKRTGRALLEQMPTLDEEDLSLWCGELMRQDLIAVKGELPPEDAAFSLTTEMPIMGKLSGAGGGITTIDAGTLISDITANVARSLEPAINASTEKKMSRTARLAAIESVSSFPAMGQSGYFIYPDAGVGLPAQPRVCIATNDVAQAKLLGLLIKRTGAVIGAVTTRAVLLGLLRSAQARPHMLFLDAEMPEIDGFRALETINATPALKSMRVVLISNRGERADLARAMMQGAAGYIIKPLRRHVMETAMTQLFGKGSKPA